MNEGEAMWAGHQWETLLEERQLARDLHTPERQMQRQDSVVRVEQALLELDDGTVVIAPPKTSAGMRSVHLPADVMRVLVARLEHFVAAELEAPVFTGRGGILLRPRTLKTALPSGSDSVWSTRGALPRSVPLRPDHGGGHRRDDEGVDATRRPRDRRGRSATSTRPNGATE